MRVLVSLQTKLDWPDSKLLVHPYFTTDSSLSFVFRQLKPRGHSIWPSADQLSSIYFCKDLFLGMLKTRIKLNI